jgi:hypothetical protein
MIHSKNQMIRSMKSYETGGASDDSCMEEYTAADGKKRRRRKSGCGKVTKYGKRGIPEGVKNVLKGVGATALGVGAYVKKEAIKAFAKDKLGIQKKGGAVKRTAKKK